MNDMPIAMSAKAAVERATAIIPQIRADAIHGEELRRLPDSSFAALEGIDIFRALRPAAAGGLQLGLDAFVDITRAVSRGDASAGWIASFVMGHNFLLSKLDADAQAEIFGDKPYVVAAATTSAAGTGEKVEGGYRLNGRWRFASAIMHSDWVALLTMTSAGPIMCAVPVGSLTVHDVWFTPGMKATGSNDAEAKDLFVPDHMAADVGEIGGWDAPGSKLFDYPLLKCGLQLVLAMIHPAVALGVADAAIELFPASLKGRKRLLAGTSVDQETAIHDIYAQAIDERRCAESRLDDAVKIITEGYNRAEPGLTSTEMAEANLALTSAGERAFRVVDMLIQSAGASIFRTGHPLERICRDTQVMRNHTVVDARYHMPACGRVLLLGEDAGALNPLKGIK